MKLSAWDRRIRRAQLLATQLPFAGEMLAFYGQIARFQADLQSRLAAGMRQLPKERSKLTEPPELGELMTNFPSFLLVVERHGPARLREIAGNLRALSPESTSQVLDAAWNASDGLAISAEGLLARAFLQPYAELLRLQSGLNLEGYTHRSCPFCNRTAGLGVLRPQGDGARRSLICSFCLAEWEFRRILCPGCGEEDNRKLPVYTANDFDYIRVEVCDTCKHYLKSVDLTRNGLADPIVDEIAAAPLDLWAQQQGYSKLQLNVVGM